MSPVWILVIVVAAILGIGVVVYLSSRPSSSSSTSSSTSGGGGDPRASDLINAIGGGLTGAGAGIARFAEEGG